MNILQINSSARSTGSASTRLADAITARVQAANPGATVTRRDLAAQPHPVLDEPTLQALFTPADKRTPEQAARIALDDALIAQVQAADVIVIGAPMYNFGITVQLKSWFDAIARNTCIRKAWAWARKPWPRHRRKRTPRSTRSWCNPQQ